MILMIVEALENPYLLWKIRCLADYQFRKGAGKELFPENVTLALSKRTGRIRYIYLNGELLATIRPSDGLLTLTVEGAERLMKAKCSKRMLVVVQDDVSSFIQKGRNVFAKHVVSASEEIRPGEEVIVVDSKSNILAVGKAILSGKEMKFFNRGVAVQVRKGSLEKG